MSSNAALGCPAPPATEGARWGKYRGTVIDTLDVTGTGRLLCEVPALPGMLLNWALPCIPYAGLEEGFYAIPPIGANVWIEFENGDPSYPIWSGCFWEEAEIPLALELSPEDPALVKVFRSAFCTLMLNDTPGEGGITLSVVDPAVDVPVTLVMNSLGLELNVGPTTILMSPETGITLSVAETVTEMTEEGIVTEAPAVDVTADDVNVTGAVSIEGDVDVVGGVDVEGETSIVGDFSVEGAVEITGAAEIAPELNVTGELSVEGDANVVGATTTEGEANILGALTVEGDQNVLGGSQVEGNQAVLGVIEGVVVPPLL